MKKPEPRLVDVAKVLDQVAKYGGKPDRIYRDGYVFLKVDTDDYAMYKQVCDEDNEARACSVKWCGKIYPGEMLDNSPAPTASDEVVLNTVDGKTRAYCSLLHSGAYK